ncbi:hypothetical protein, partial [Desulfurobacterium sp.]
MRKALFALTICALLASNALAVENTATLNSDITQKKYQRKTAVSVGEMELQKPFVILPVIDNTRKRPRKIANYMYQITNNEIDPLTKLFYNYVITQRFDKLIILPNKVILITKTGEATLNTNLPQPSIPQGIDFKTYKQNVENYLNTQIAPVMEKLLEITLDQRYKELPEQEKMTFITQKAKELGLTAEVAEKLMNSGFAFATYIPTIKGNLTINKSILAGTSNPYNAQISLEAQPVILIYRFDGDKKTFVPYKQIVADSGITSQSISLKRPVYSPRYYRNLFDRTLALTIKAAAINAGMELKEDDNFAIFSPAEEVEGNSFKAKVGVAEAIRIDAPFDIYEFENGKKVYKGFGKARDVAYNCEIESTNKTKFDLVKGNVEEYDQLREHPWSGVLFGIQAGVTPFSVTEVAGQSASGGGDWATFRITIDADLGYIANSKALSE